MAAYIPVVNEQLFLRVFSLGAALPRVFCGEVNGTGRRGARTVHRMAGLDGDRR